jgi:hypothetical protein
VWHCFKVFTTHIEDMAAAPININAHIEVFSSPAHRRAIRTLDVVPAGTIVLQDQQPILSIDTGVPFDAWSDDANNVQTDWPTRQQFEADTGNQNLRVSVTLGQTQPGSQGQFRSLYRDNPAGGPEAQNDYNILLRNSIALSDGSAQSTAFLRVYYYISRINHSCRPNAVMSIKDSTGNIDIITIKDLNPQDELTINYLEGDWLGTAHQRNLVFQASWGFTCNCVDCLPNGRVEGNKIRRRLDATTGRWNTLNAAWNASNGNWDTVQRTNALTTIMERVSYTEVLVGKSDKWIDT